MKRIIKNLGVLFIITLVLFSCRKEDMEIIDATEETTAINSNVSSLLLRTATNDGSYDNILDGASCFNIKLPVTVIANGEEVVIETESDIDIVEDIFDQFTDDTDTLEIMFPVTIVLDDYSEVIINSQSELNAAAFNCPTNGDDDIECIDIQYPITASIFNQNNELIDTLVINDDEDLFDLLDDVDEDIIIAIDFPITVILADGTTVQVENFVQLEDVISNAIDSCDEDDDNDPNDDDCNNCTTQQLTDVLTNCEDWSVDKLERDDEDLEDNYVGYSFNFDAGGGITVSYNGMSYNGTYSASGDGNNITVTINISDLPDFNDTWNLHEIEVDDTPHVELRKNGDRLRFKSDCNSSGGGVDDTVLVNALTNGDWYVNYYFDDTDETADFADYVFNFATDNTATATDGSGSTNGTWSTSAGDETELELNLNFGTSIPLDELAEDWDVLEVTNEIIRLKDVSGGDGSTDFLTFGRDPFSGGGGGADLEDYLDAGTWFVSSYLDDGNDETADYAGYNLDFDVGNGTVVANNGSNTNNGTWQVLNSGNKLLLDFGVEFPFDEFNDDWDVLSATENQVVLQDISGGNGGTDTLTLQKN